MALAVTTLTSACSATDNQIVVALATSLAAGRFIKIDSEMMQVTKGYVTASLTVPVTRGVNGTVAAVHVAGGAAAADNSLVIHGDAADFSDVAAGGPMVTFPAQPAVDIVAYSATGAIALPKAGTNRIVKLNGTTVCVMTLANPTLEMDGTRLTIIASGTAAHTGAAHTVTFASGVNGTAYVTFTFTAYMVGFEVIALNQRWNILNSAGFAGTITNALITVT
jgi:hypothetical protein